MLRRLPHPSSLLMLLWPRRTGDNVVDNTRVLYADVLWSSLLTGIIQTFTAVYLLRIGGTALQVGLLVSLPAIGGTLLSLRAANFVRRHHSDIRLVVIPPFYWRLGYALLVIVPFFPHSVEGWIFITIIFLGSFPTVISNIAIVSQIAEAIPPDKRAEVLSWRNTLAGLSTTLSAFLGGIVLSFMPVPFNYQVVFVLAFAISLIGLYHRHRLILPKDSDDTAKQQQLQSIRVIMKRPAFRRFMTGLIFYLAGLYLPQALFSIYLVKILRAADDQIGLAATLGSLAATVSYPIWGRYMTQQRLRLLLALSCIGWGLFPALVSLTPNITIYIFVAIYANLFGSGVTTSIVQVLMGIGPSTERPTRVAIYNTLVGGAGVLLPTLGTALLRIIDIHIVLLIAATLRIFAGIIFATIPQWQADKA